MSRVPPTIVRRLVLAPLVFAVSLGEVVVSPLLAVVAVVVDLFVARHRMLRLVAFGTLYCAYEALGLVAIFGLWVRAGAGLWLANPRIQDAHYHLMAWWLQGLRVAAQRIFRLSVAIENGTGPRPGPILVFSRHGGAGNSLVLVATLLLEFSRRPRVVMLEKLRWEPLFDALLSRIPNAFVRPGNREENVAAIGRLAQGLGPHDAFVLFPEGHDFTPGLRSRAILHLRRRGDHESAAKAELMPNVLPPRLGGVTAAITNAPQADVIFVAHTLFEDVGSLAQLWRRIPLNAQVSARYWRVPAAEVPREDLEDWLFAWWAAIDAWISERVVPPVPGTTPDTGAGVPTPLPDRQAHDQDLP
ncbi:MAG: lysophospholipid acyltransferase family protein [Actinomycetota bacterium]